MALRGLNSLVNQDSLLRVFLIKGLISKLILCSSFLKSLALSTMSPAAEPVSSIVVRIGSGSVPLSSSDSTGTRLRMMIHSRRSSSAGISRTFTLSICNTCSAWGTTIILGLVDCSSRASDNKTLSLPSGRVFLSVLRP